MQSFQQDAPCGIIYPQFDPAAMQPLQQDSDVLGEIWNLARTEQGSRRVQKAFDEAASNEQRMALASELHTHVWAALQCPHANHILKKVIETMPPHHLQFIIDEIGVRVEKVAKHTFGCRILQRLIEHCPPQQIRGLVDELLKSVVALSTHTYGTYVMQSLLAHGSASKSERGRMALAEPLSYVTGSDHGCRVLAKSLELDAALANALLKQPDLLPVMACSRHGFTAVRLALEKAEEPHRQAALDVLEGQERMLVKTRYGRKTLAVLRGNAEEVSSDHS